MYCLNIYNCTLKTNNLDLPPPHHKPFLNLPNFHRTSQRKNWKYNLKTSEVKRKDTTCIHKLFFISNAALSLHCTWNTGNPVSIQDWQCTLSLKTTFIMLMPMCQLNTDSKLKLERHKKKLKKIRSSKEQDSYSLVGKYNVELYPA